MTHLRRKVGTSLTASEAIRSLTCPGRAKREPGPRCQFAKLAICRPWIPALRSLRSLGRDTTENICDAVGLEHDPEKWGAFCHGRSFCSAANKAFAISSLA